MSELKQVFSVNPRSTFELLGLPSIGYYIPAYQRKYDWKESNINQLIENVAHGIAVLKEGKGESITFLGSIILIHDVKYLTVAPQVKGELPAKVMLIIDGQQRITTLLLLNAVLHSKIGELIKKLGKKGPATDFGLEWIRQHAIQTRANLALTLYQDSGRETAKGEQDQKYYPRAIRAYDDSWSYRAEQAKYTSPIARFLHSYGIFARDADQKKAYKLDDVDDEDKHRALRVNWKALGRHVDAIADGRAEEMDMPEPFDLGTDAEEAIFQQALPPEVSAFRGSSADPPTSEQTAGSKLLRLVLFARYLLSNVAVTEVVVQDDRYAFDIFEALNTSGEPLTAFDTFRPKVVLAEGHSGYKKSPSFKPMKEVEDYFETHTAAEMHSANERLLTPFALAETGKKLSQRLADQRNYLKDQFDLKVPDGDEAVRLVQRRSFVEHLAHAADFRMRVWPHKGDAVSIAEFEGLGPRARAVTAFALEVLRDAKHVVTIGPLLRFFSRMRQAGDETSRKSAALELAGAIRAVAAFFGLYRGSRATTATDNIDQHYRTLMLRGFPTGPESMCGPFARRPPDRSGEQPTLARFQEALRHALSDKTMGNVPTKDEFVSRASSLAVYGTPFAKLLLFAATHDSHADSAAPGLIVRGKAQSLDVLTVERWKELTIEHIAPKNSDAKGWKGSSLYEELGTIDRLGNLTLLPGPENASVSDREWEVKKLYYSIFSAPDPTALKAMMEKAKGFGIAVGEITPVMESARLHPQLSALSTVEHWTSALVEGRSRRIAELAWDQLSGWLGYPSLAGSP